MEAPVVLLFKSRGWWGPAHGGTHVKRAPMSDSDGSGAAVGPQSAIGAYLNEHVYGREKGEHVPRARFLLGQFPESTIKKISQFIDGYSSKHASVYVSGKSLKHADEQRHDALANIAEKLPEIVRLEAEILHNPNRDNSAFLVYRDKANYLLALEISKVGDGTDVVNIITTRDRGLRRHREKSSEWQGGRQPSILATGDSPAGGDEFSDVQPIGKANIHQPIKKSIATVVVFKRTAQG